MASPCVRGGVVKGSKDDLVLGEEVVRAVKMTFCLCFLIPMAAAELETLTPSLMRPSFHPGGLSFDDVSSKSESEITQLWHLNGRCPEETIPIRRTKEEDLLRASSVANYGRNKYAQFDTTGTNKTAIQENAIVFVKEDKYYGTKATINAWKPQIQEQVEFSFSQLEIFGVNATTEINTIEAGWMVSYTLYGDYNSRLFGFFYNNKDINQTRACYNLLCSPGFVQINKEIALGGSLNPISVYAGSQYELHFLVWKYLMGYWPASLFVSLSESASQILWGRETNKKMGSTPPHKWAAVISLKKGSAGLVTSKIYKLLMVQTFSGFPKKVIVPLQNQIAIMSQIL
ncbi:hypothetical protein CFP56_030812 [Quercus suber]|uniref:Neprosin PEP catalytic domain-containing protein n=1 Tax=Quercus suber TaxID=58331 RepID=A0AAW0JNT3_QUESU